MAEVGSESAQIVTSLKIARDHEKEAMRKLKGNHPAQITLARILRGAGFKHAFQGMLIPTDCQNKERSGSLCGQEDSLEHLVDRHGLKRYSENEPYVVELIVKMARSPLAVPPAPGVSVPKYIV